MGAFGRVGAEPLEGTGGKMGREQGPREVGTQGEWALSRPPRGRWA